MKRRHELSLDKYELYSVIDSRLESVIRMDEMGGESGLNNALLEMTRLSESVDALYAELKSELTLLQVRGKTVKEKES